jgi:hypothetical protein
MRKNHTFSPFSEQEQNPIPLLPSSAQSVSKNPYILKPQNENPKKKGKKRKKITHILFPFPFPFLYDRFSLSSTLIPFFETPTHPSIHPPNP